MYDKILEEEIKKTSEWLDFLKHIQNVDRKFVMRHTRDIAIPPVNTISIFVNLEGKLCAKSFDNILLSIQEEKDVYVIRHSFESFKKFTGKEFKVLSFTKEAMYFKIVPTKKSSSNLGYEKKLTNNNPTT